MPRELCLAIAWLAIITVLSLAGLRLASDNPNQPLITQGETPCNCPK